MQWLNCTLVTGASPLTEQWDTNPVQLSSLDVGTRVSHYPTPTSSIVSLYISILSLFVLITLLSVPKNCCWHVYMTLTKVSFCPPSRTHYLNKTAQLLSFHEVKSLLCVVLPRRHWTRWLGTSYRSYILIERVCSVACGEFYSPHNIHYTNWERTLLSSSESGQAAKYWFQSVRQKPAHSCRRQTGFFWSLINGHALRSGLKVAFNNKAVFPYASKRYL